MAYNKKMKKGSAFLDTPVYLQVLLREISSVKSNICFIKHTCFLHHFASLNELNLFIL